MESWRQKKEGRKRGDRESRETKSRERGNRVECKRKEMHGRENDFELCEAKKSMGRERVREWKLRRKAQKGEGGVCKEAEGR